MSMHGAAHHNFAASQFVKEDVFVEWAEYDEKPPVAESRMTEAAARPKLGVLFEKLDGGFDGIKIVFRDFPVRIEHIPFKLPLNVRDEVVRALRTLMFSRARGRVHEWN
jgi:hypothetical protein